MSNIQSIKAQLVAAARLYEEARGADPVVAGLFGIAVELCNRVEVGNSDLAEARELHEFQADKIRDLQLALEESEATVMRLEAQARAVNAA